MHCSVHSTQYKAKHNLLPGNIQKMFRDREGEYDLRGRWSFKQPIVHTTLKSMSISVCGLKQWNTLTDDIKESTNLGIFKKECKDMTGEEQTKQHR